MKSPKNNKPNILFITTDQQRGDCLGVEGHPVLLTPNMDGIAASGVRFSSFYAACPTCIAVRRSILSGQHPHTHGLVGYQDGVEWNAPVTLPGALRDAGYQTRLVGRSMHQHPGRKRFGYDEMILAGNSPGNEYHDWVATVGPRGNSGWFGGGVMHNDWTARPWHLEEYLHTTNWTVDRALEFLSRRDPSCPYFLNINFIAPHPPLQPPAFYMDRYLRTGVPEPHIGDWAVPPVLGEGRFFHDGRYHEDHISSERVHLTGEALQSARAAYYGLVNHVDDQLRRLLNPIIGIDALSERTTIVVFTSDHGEMLGDHHLWKKGLAYESSARVPFLICAPNRFDLKKTSLVDYPCTHVDIMPTLLEMAGVEIPATVEGMSLLPLLRGEQVDWREYVHIEHAPATQSVTNGQEKYIWYNDDGREQFFDLSTDPHECRNLIQDKAYSDRVDFWKGCLIRELNGRPEGFSDGKRLIPGRDYKPVLN